MDFPSFWEGLSLRPAPSQCVKESPTKFPFLLGRAFIEAGTRLTHCTFQTEFPFLLGRAFIEAVHINSSFLDDRIISLPSGKGFH